jgi:2-(1,2-epoxy-1,2-dihydrophenyl)acetyl-CoA isomerase
VTDSDTVLWDRDDAVATITLNRPRARNALTAEMKDALLAALRLAAAEPWARAVVLTGAGEAFCAGQDLREHAEVLASGGEPTGTVRRHYNPIITTIMTMPKPVIAAVNGSAAGAGASLALACDLRIAAQRASLLMAFARVGPGADSGASWTLQRLAGGPTAAYAGIKAQLLYSATHGLEESLENEARVQAELGATADHRAATAAFLNREKPAFEGR